MDSNISAIESIYRQRADKFFAAEKQYANLERMVMNLRVATFIGGAVMFVLGWNSQQQRLWYWAGCIAIAGFFALVAYHERVRRQMQRYRLLRRINQQAIARLSRDWAALNTTHVAVPPQHQALAADLDLFGHASLFHFLCTAATPIGIRVLGDWLLDPASAEEIKRRQQAVSELAPHLELRQNLILNGLLLADRGRATERFVDWAEGAPWLAARPRLLWLIRIVSAAAALILVLMCFRFIPTEIGVLAVLGVLLSNALITALFGGKVHGIFSIINLRRNEAARYRDIFELMYSMPDSSAELAAVKAEASSHGGGVLLRMRQLNRIAALAMFYRSPPLRIFVYLPLQSLFLYDFHILNLLEAWQTGYGRYVRAWFQALGKFEALSSLASVAHDHPQWAMSEVDPSAERFQARKMGHPLLPCLTRVDNDVEVGPAGSCLLVTGSNMSGKSTLLRAIGVNAILAQAGAPVCAERLAMPPVSLATSMRIRDSLEYGVSFYMAQLMRLKEIVDLARDPKARNNRPLLYLLDEILLGTNSRERHIAVVRVLHCLVQCEAIGAVSTHDLDLAAGEPLSGVCRCVHFRETLHDQHAQQPMTFDYILRPGMATTTNALKLLEIVGLGENAMPQ
jgi:ABC-type multidrug transport system fused ATPase/permease subunit